MEKAREHHIYLYVCFIDYKKVFDCVDHEGLCVILRDMGVSVHLIVLLRRLYTNQEATVRTEFGETENFDIWKGVRQGCILSPQLFNIYAENITREALEEWERGISIGGRMMTNLRYADETTLLGKVNYRGRTMREGSAKKNSYGKSRNGRTNINMEGQRRNAGDEGETSESVGVPDITIWSGDLDNEKT